MNNLAQKFLLSSTLITGIALGASADTPYEEPDGSWVTISGTIASAGDEAFVLDYGKGLVTVEMDDWDWYEEGAALIEGDTVTVTGRVDDDLYELTSVEASRVYVDDLNTYFYASGVDEEDVAFAIATPPIVGIGIDYVGRVTSVDGREFTIDQGYRELEVDTDEMAYNPMDDKGYQQIEVGDLVKVYGTIDDSLFDDKELEATTIITLVEDVTKNADESS